MAIAGFIMLLLYLIGAVGWAVPELEDAAHWVTNSESRYPEGLLETLEALLWIAAAILFGALAIRKAQASGADRGRDRMSGEEHGTDEGRRRPGLLRGAVLWPALFCLVCFLSFGEETSWGQHVGLITPDAATAELSSQGEVNIHNLDIARIVGLPDDHVLTPYLSNFATLLNPIFYASWLVAIVVIPFAIRRGWLEWRVLRGYPVASAALSAFFLANFLAWLVVDELYDVAELFESAIVVSAVLLAWEALARSEARSRQPARQATAAPS